MSTAQSGEITRHEREIVVDLNGDKRSILVCWTDACDGMYPVDARFAARAGQSGTKLWQVHQRICRASEYASLAQPDGSVKMQYRRCTILNRANGYIVGWWNDDTMRAVESKHISATSIAGRRAR